MRLAIAQMRVVRADKTRNLVRAAELIAHAAADGADVVLLPEAMTLGWADPSAVDAADEIPDGESIHALSAAARSHNVMVVAGVVERAQDAVYNSAVLISADRDVLLVHRKINELPLARGLYAVGDSVRVADTPPGRIGLMVCADGFADGEWITRELVRQGAEVILSPCSWVVTAADAAARTPYGDLWRSCYEAVTAEHDVVIAAASDVGTVRTGEWAGRAAIGNSLVIGPGGVVLLEAPYGAEALCLVDLPTRSA